MKTYSKIKGFTLVELSIVLVIIGLLVGGVLQGRELIEAAERNALITEFTNLQTNYNAFQLNYGGIPGDMKDAHDYWGADCDADTVKCNGDGNGRVEYSATSFEQWYFWKHLVLAEYYDVYTTNYERGYRPDSIDNAGLWTTWKAHYSNRYNGNRNVVTLWRRDDGGSVDQGTYTNRNAKAIDIKLDDGNPTKGVFQSIDGLKSGDAATAANCVNATSDGYKLTNPDEYDCVIMFGVY